MLKVLSRSIAIGGLALIALAPLAYAAPFIPAPPSGYVLDLANLLSPEAEAILESQLTTLEEETSTEIAVVTVPTLQDYSIEEYTIRLARDWGVGQEEFDNGLILLVAPNERKVRIEVGYGLEGVVTDAQSNAVINEVLIPFFKDGLYEDGILQGVGYLDLMARDEEFLIEQVSHFGDDDFFYVMLVYFLPFFYMFMSLMSHSKSWWLGGLVGGFVALLAIQTLIAAAIGLGIGLFVDFILSTFFYQKINMPKGGKYGGGGGFSSGGGGFGGGSFGGGGASGSW